MYPDEGVVSGLLQIFRNGEWGSVCMTGWNSREYTSLYDYSGANAIVACGQLGMVPVPQRQGPSSYPPIGSVTLGDPITRKPYWVQPVFMDRVRCDPARHKALHECDFAGWGVTDCTEEEGVVALICSKEGGGE
ncbi:hypothetical protein HYH03_016716 [Edaphochlamys debaryana]|uniref:SRCR domain-containing protein n=1 Tax=Edaphochlamys debaryana TaxID=47281 RepID=A0A835XJA9_9CHLO|nr:hypothetical protein HYH03_016716 [Edaphochlamys debaryana]|eukprot:KAG2484484.1 hypothetical protein HYH03_016716 [Edaphochlamys debaryana]